MIKKMKLNGDTISYVVMGVLYELDQRIKNSISNITKIPYVMFPENSAFSMLVFQIHYDAFTNIISMRLSSYTCTDEGLHLDKDVNDSVDYSIDRASLINRWAMLIVDTLESWIPTCTCMNRDVELYSKYLSFDDAYTICDGAFEKVKTDDSQEH